MTFQSEVRVTGSDSGMVKVTHHYSDCEVMVKEIQDGWF